MDGDERETVQLIRSARRNSSQGGAEADAAAQCPVAVIPSVSASGRSSHPEPAAGGPIVRFPLTTARRVPVPPVVILYIVLSALGGLLFGVGV
jgi:hypothetical protein